MYYTNPEGNITFGTKLFTLLTSSVTSHSVLYLQIPASFKLYMHNNVKVLLPTVYTLLSLFTAHGTFIGKMRLEAHKPTQVPLDSILSFGASTRTYILRERPAVILPLISEGIEDEDGEGGTLLGLPELDNDVDVSQLSCQS